MNMKVFVLFFVALVLFFFDGTNAQGLPPFPGRIRPGVIVPGPGARPGPMVPGGPAVGIAGRGRPTLMGDRYTYATCYFNDTYSMVRGRVDMRQEMVPGVPSIDVRVQITGLEQTLMSDTEHAIHVHQWGDIGRGCYNAGPHYDRDSFSFHGGPNSIGRNNRHDGDWGNLRQSNAGIIDAPFTVQGLSLLGEAGIAGRSIVVKQGRDDLGRGGNPMSLVTGNSGPPIACCTIGLADSTNWQNPIMRNGQFMGFNSGQFQTMQGANTQFNNQPSFLG